MNNALSTLETSSIKETFDLYYASLNPQRILPFFQFPAILISRQKPVRISNSIIGYWVLTLRNLELRRHGYHASKTEFLEVRRQRDDLAIVTGKVIRYKKDNSELERFDFKCTLCCVQGSWKIVVITEVGEVPPWEELTTTVYSKTLIVSIINEPEEIEEFKEWLNQVKLSFTKAILSLSITQTIDGSEQYLCVEKWLNFFAAPTSGLEHHYRAIKKRLAESVHDLKLSDSDKSNILCCFNAWLALEWIHNKKLFAPSNHNLKELKAIIAALQNSGHAVEEKNNHEYKLLNGEAEWTLLVVRN